MAAMRATPPRLGGFAVATSIRTDGRRPAPSGDRARPAFHGRNGGNGHGPWPARVLRRDLGRDDGGDDAALGLSCLGCSAALMVAMVLLGMSSLWWAVMGIVVLIYKFA